MSVTVPLGFVRTIELFTYDSLVALRTLPGGLFAMSDLYLVEPHLERVRRLIEEQYEAVPTECGASFGEILCWEIHSNGMTFNWLAQKWGLSLPVLGELISDHCKRLEIDPVVVHDYRPTAAHSERT